MKFNKRYSIILLYNEKLEFFIQDRRTISKDGEEYGFFGGGVEDGETFEEALVREAKEELNINIDGNYEYIGNTIFNLKGFSPQQTNLYLVKYIPEYDIDLKIFEGDGGEYLTLDEYVKMKISPWNYIAVEMIKEYFKNK